ncbi:MAG: glycosyltransferase family 2 protein [Akkermansia sp.]|nr:glycosyltransferase family 2 protein [Akkermansia sp.]
MQATPKVSIVTPVYNAEQYLRECLDSLCNQTYKNLEIVCVDDGSTDESLKILHEYAVRDERIVVLSQKNSGQAVARNTAMNIATGEWVTGVDSDDYLDVTAIEKAISQVSDDVDLVYFNILKFQETDVEKKELCKFRYEGKCSPSLEVISNFPTEFCAKLWRRSMLDKYCVRCPEGIQFEDLPFVRMGISVARKIVGISEGLYAYRQRENSSFNLHLAKKGGAGVLDYLKIADMCIAFWRANHIENRLGKKDASTLELLSLRYTVQHLNRLAANEYLHDAWKEMRRVVDKYELGNRLPEFLDVAFYYYIPPYTRPMIHEMIKAHKEEFRQAPELRKDMLLLANSRDIYWKYKKAQFLTFLTWGDTRKKYDKIKSACKEKMRVCRKLRKEGKELFKI